jgi:hypothetical protein
MTREELIRLAIEAKLVCDWDGGCASAWVEGHDLTPYLERFAALVAAHERERMAQKWEYVWSKDFRGVAKAIREEGQE